MLPKRILVWLALDMQQYLFKIYGQLQASLNCDYDLVQAFSIVSLDTTLKIELKGDIL